MRGAYKLKTRDTSHSSTSMQNSTPSFGRASYRQEGTQQYATLAFSLGREGELNNIVSRAIEIRGRWVIYEALGFRG